MEKKYKVITLCGSTKFKEVFIEAQKKLTLDGNIVISVGLFGHDGDNEVWENMDEGTVTQTKKMLDDMNKAKIDMSDEIFVINIGGYIGECTKSEIEYAKSKGKVVRYLERIEPEKKSINSVASAISDARKSEEDGDVVKAIQILWDALRNKSPNEKQIQIIKILLL